MIRYPGPGCLVEFMQGNRAQQAMILDEQSGQMRLYTISRREVRLPANRLLPWFGPRFEAFSSKQEIQSILELSHAKREALMQKIDPVYLWELAKDEITQASARWFAELIWQEPDFDQVSACGQALLDCKTHFKFHGFDFELLAEDKVKAKLRENQLAQERAEVLCAGRVLLPVLWEAFRKNQIPLPQEELAKHLAGISAEQQSRLESLLRTRLGEPDDHESSVLWRELSKPLPDNPHLPLNLLEAWGKIPAHYNFGLDRIGYRTDPDWFAPYVGQIENVLNSAQVAAEPFLDLPFISVDTRETEDFDDAFHLERDCCGNYLLYIAIACPAFNWPWSSELDKAVLRRASSIYLPESNLHMLPEPLGVQGLSLNAQKIRRVMLGCFKLSPAGEIIDFSLDLRRIKVDANLIYEDCEAVLDQGVVFEPDGRGKPNAAPAYADMLQEAYRLALCLQNRRVERGAVIIIRPEPKISLHNCNECGSGAVRVEISSMPPSDKAQMMVGEFMVLLNGAVAQKSLDWGLPLIYRTQHVALPKDYAGIWTRPEEIARVVKSLPPASLDSVPRPHTGLGLTAYATISSPLRRYVDLFNQGQILQYLSCGKPLFDKAELSGMLPLISARSDSAAQIQKQRPRYWKLVYFKQNGDKKWYDATIADENDLFVTVSLFNEAFLLRGKRQLFSDKAMPGQSCAVRIGKVHPLDNEIQIVAVEEY